jgi:hypothetical protein
VQFASFDLGDPVFDCFGRSLSFQLVTLENLHGLDASRTEVLRSDAVVSIRARGLASAGQQERAEGEVEIEVVREGAERLRVRIRARAEATIRCAKLLVRDLDPSLRVLRADGEGAPVGRFGELLEYPTRLPAPALRVRAGGELLGVRFEDARVRAKRFAAWVERLGPLAGRGVVEAIHEEDATRFGGRLETPDLVLASGMAAERLLEDQLAFAERHLGLVPWAERRDVPDWARRLRLVATLHGMHFTGRVFLRYAEMLDVLRFLAARVPGERILAYLPGWEGRYYWQYGDYRPEPRLGGSAELARLCEGARELGVRVMPMFGANCANRGLPSVAALPDAAHLKSATRNRFHGNQPDWDLSRAHDTGWQAWLNPGHPGWREHLAGQIERVIDAFGMDAVFLDTVHAWTNDPDHPVHDGVRALVERLRARRPGLLLAGEADYDALLGLFPLFQRPWWESPPAWTARYVRRFGHLCEGEPRGRTGVHEFGTWGPSLPGGDDPALLATLAFQDGTLESERGRIEAVLARLGGLTEAASSPPGVE